MASTRRTPVTSPALEKLRSALGLDARAKRNVTLAALAAVTRPRLLAAARLAGLTGVGHLDRQGLVRRLLARMDRLAGARATRGASPATTAAPKATGADRQAKPAVRRPAAAGPREQKAGSPGHAAPARPRQHGKPGSSKTAHPRRRPVVRETNGTVLATEEAAGERVLRSKFEVGPSRESPAHQIPWSYGVDRVTAMVVDPDRLFVYWEVRDDSMETARRDLGAGGPGAWLALRLYDVSGRIFDGTNAHRYFDVKVQRTDRQWFVDVGQPASTWCVEVGMKSHEGYFQKIARSGRADFPRRGPSPRQAVEWMTVRVETGETRREGGGPAPVAQPAPDAAAARVGGPLFAAVERESRQVMSLTRETIETAAWEAWQELRREWTAEGARIEWVSPVTRTVWAAGPFTTPVAAPAYSEERWSYEGPVRIETLDGVTRVVHGPWQVVIRGIDARAEKRVLATWHFESSWLTEASRDELLEIWRRWSAGPGGASELWGASETLLLRGSELRLRGASELFLLGASERLWGGASELLFAGASESRLRGASERRLGGASETLLAGGSEQSFAGSIAGALGGGASEVFAGASEDRPLPHLS